MNEGRTVFAQLMDELPQYEFHKCVRRYDGNHHVRSLFPWAKFRRHKAALKLHTLLTLRGNFPTVIILTTGKVHDVNILDELSYEAGSFYIIDRG